MNFYHVPILLNEVKEGLRVKKNGVYIDMTYGSGGYTKAILDAEKKLTVVAFDCDADAIKNAIDDSRLKLFHANYRYFNNFLEYLGIKEVDGIVADLGVSSYQFDTAERGFSFRFDATLDLRMNKDAKLNAASVLNSYSSEQLAKIFFYYGQLKESRPIAQTIVNARELKPIRTTQELVGLLKPFAPKGKEHKFFAKVFQALRIEVNDELNALKEMLIKSLHFLKRGGRMCIVTYHSLEDTLVKNFFRSGNTEGIIEKDVKGNVINEVFLVITKKPVVPALDEINENHRARSAKLRIAERL